MRRRGTVLPFPGARAAPAPAEARDLVEVHRCDQAEAVVVRSLFESEGIPVLLRSHLVLSVHPFTVGEQGRVVVLVPRGAAGRSRALLGRLAPGGAAP